MLTILLFGPPKLLHNGRPLLVTRRKSRALVYYLAAQAAPITRDQVIGLLWPDLDRAAAQQTLRTTLHGLRKVLGPALAANDDTLAIAPDTFVDVRRFEAQLARPAAEPEELALALELYRGDLLHDFILPDSPDFDEWAAGERERYRRLAVRGFTSLARQYEARRDFAAALDALTRALTFEPLQEDLQRAAMRLHYLAGDRAGAIRRYEHLRGLLDDELGVPPMAETRALYDAIITDTLEPERVNGRTGERVIDEPAHPFARSPAHPLTSPSLLPFTGRAAELQALDGLVGTQKLVLIEGEPGIGKTYLAETFMRHTERLWLVGTAHELEQALPYQPIVEALRSLLARDDWPVLYADLAPSSGTGPGLPEVWLAETARLLPELAGATAGKEATLRPHPPVVSAPQLSASESRLWEGINQFLVALARRRPLAFLFDDLHWADASTLGLLGYLVRQSTAPIFFLATARPAVPRAPLVALLQTLTRAGRLQRMPLARLTPHEMTALARHLSPSYAYPLADWFGRTSEGNPYILAELARYAREHQLLLPDGTLNLTALSAAPVVPQTVYSLIQSRLARLSDTARRVLDVAVAVGREFDIDVVANAASLSDQAVFDALADLHAAGLIAPLDGMRYAFDHSLTMEVAFRELGDPRHRMLHRHVGEALEHIHRGNLDTVAGLLASHFAEGNAPARAAPYAFRAGQQAAALAAWAEAIAFYEQALAGADEEQQLAALMALGQARFNGGSQAQASEAYRAALELAQARGDMDGAQAAALELAQTFLAQSRFAEAIALAQQVIAGGTPAQVVQAELVWGAALSIEGADLAGAAEHLQKATTLCAEQSSQATLAQVRFELGNVLAQQGDLRWAVERYREALAAAERDEAAIPQRILALNNLAYHLHLLGDPAASEYAQAGLHLAQGKGLLSFQTYLLSTLGEIALAAGDLPAAEQHFTEGLALAEELSLPERIAGITANLGLLALRSGQTALAINRLSSALARADALGTRHLAAQIRLWLAPLLPPASARARLAEARTIAESGGRRRLLDEIEALERQISALLA